MKKTFFKFSLMVFAILATIGCNKQQTAENVIFLIGDGMGLGAISQLLLYEEEPTAIEEGFVIGLSETRSANNFVTDSPAGGTALATGTRTNNGYLGVDPEGKQLTSLLKKAQAKGKKSGIVVNTVLTEATPGAFYAGVKKRAEVYKIAEQFLDSGVDLAIGSGLSAFINRPDSVDLTQKLIEKGYDVILDRPTILAPDSQKYIGILPEAGVHRRNKSKDITAKGGDGAPVCIAAKMAAESDDNFNDNLDINEPEKYMPKALTKALETLSNNNGKGFFLMVESAIIDGYGHNNDSYGLLDEMQEFNETVKVVKAFAQSHPNTLLVITADHETGGVGVSYRVSPENMKDTVKVVFSTTGHTGTVVPVFALGPGAEKFDCIMKNIDIPAKISEIAGL